MDKALVFEVVSKALIQALVDNKLTYANYWEARRTIYDTLEDYRTPCALSQEK